MALKKAKGLNDEVILASTRRYLLKVYLQDNQEKAVGIVTEVLTETDISSRHPVALELKSYLGLAEVPAGSKAALLEELGKIEVADRPNWKTLMETWQSPKPSVPEPAKTE